MILKGLTRFLEGGIPRSGTTLLRAMLDAHPDVRCGEETRVIPSILALVSKMKRNTTGLFLAILLQVIAGHGAPAPRLCNKDPYTLNAATYLARIFPNARFLFVIRDGRATVHSMISRKIPVERFNVSSYRQSLKAWNEIISTMDEQCRKISIKCLRVYYEQLVLHPESEMRRILEFLELPWSPSVLRHEHYIGKKIKLSKMELSSDQVIKPLNTDALSKWVGAIPKDVVKEMEAIAPMLRQLGYDPNANPPNYGIPDELVAKKTEDLHKNGEEWYKKAKMAVDNPNRVDKPKH
ncbi:hypothetical protein OSTOST_17924 [Ostertagia ostertagi]